MKLAENTSHKLILAGVAIIMLFMLFIIGRNLVHALQIKGSISTLEAEAEYYKEHIKADSMLLEDLKFDDKLEKYAREHYRMQRKGESVYIVE